MPLPTFIVIGERRSGTTSLARWLSAHPQIYLHPHLDMAYFVEEILKHRKDLCKGQVQPEEWYNDHSPEDYAAMFTGARGEKAIGEKSADYLFWTHAHARIKEFCPNVKLIVTLRDPVERAWSHYWGEVGKGRENLSFEDALEAEPERMAASDYCKDHLSYVRRGFYDESLAKLFETFDPGQVHVVTLDEMKTMPQETLAPLFEFLGVDAVPDLKQPVLSQNKSWTTLQNDFVRSHRVFSALESGFVWACRKRLKYAVRDLYRRTQIQLRFEGTFRKTKNDFVMKEDTRQRLMELYDPHMKATEELIGKNPCRW